MMKRLEFSKTILVIFCVALFVIALGNSVWAVEENWDEIIAKAKEEGKVATYNTSGRMAKAGEAFEKKYGIKVEALKIGDAEITDRIIREKQAGVNEVDLIMSEDIIGVNQQMIPAGYVSSYLPSTHQDIILEGYQEPLVFLLQGRTLGYNSEEYAETPIESLWELTTKEWEGRFFLRDPELTPATVAFMAEIVSRAEEMAVEYERFFGKPIELTTPNAGWEFIKRLAENKPVTFRSDGSTSEAVGARGQKNSPIGFYATGKHRPDILETKNLALKPCIGVKPVIGYVYPAYILQVANAPHPNAAKLFTQFLLEEEGVYAWTQDIGCFSTNPNVPSYPDCPIGGIKEWAKVTWPLNPENTVLYSRDVLDFWIRYRK